MAATMTQLDADEEPELDARALTEYMTVLDDGDVRARSSPDLYLVTTQSGSAYLVDASLSACECADHEYRDRTCKHLRRVAFATGRREIPEWIDSEDVDPQLRVHVDDVHNGRGAPMAHEERMDPCPKCGYRPFAPELDNSGGDCPQCSRSPLGGWDG